MAHLAQHACEDRAVVDLVGLPDPSEPEGAERPRLAVFRSNLGISAQLVDDDAGKTVAAASWQQLKKSFKGSKTEQAAEVGKLLAASALTRPWYR